MKEPVRTDDKALELLDQAYEQYKTFRAVSLESDLFKGIPPGSLCAMYKHRYIVDKWRKQLNCRKTKPRNRHVFNCGDVDSFLATLEKYTSDEFRKELKERL